MGIYVHTYMCLHTDRERKSGGAVVGQNLGDDAGYNVDEEKRAKRGHLAGKNSCC